MIYQKSTSESWKCLSKALAHHAGTHNVCSCDMHDKAFSNMFPYSNFITYICKLNLPMVDNAKRKYNIISISTIIVWQEGINPCKCDAILGL